MNKRILATQVKRILSSGNSEPEQDLGDREVQLVVSQVADELLQDYLFKLHKESKAFGFNVPREYLKRYVLPITNKTATLTTTPIKLPRNRTIYEANIEGSNCETEGQMLIPILEPLGMFRRRESADLEGHYGYQVDYSDNGVSIKLVNDKKGLIQSIEVYIVPSTETLGVEEELPLPHFLQDQVLDRVIKRFMLHVEIPHDDKIDNKDGR